MFFSAACGEGEFKAGVGNSPCEMCPENSVVSAMRTDCVCIDGYTGPSCDRKCVVYVCVVQYESKKLDTSNVTCKVTTYAEVIRKSLLVPAKLRSSYPQVTIK